MYIVHQCLFTLFILLHFENLHHKWAFRYSLFHLKLRIQQRKGLCEILSSPMSKLENTGKMSRLLIPQFHPPVSPWCDVPMALNYVNCLPNQPVYEAAADQWERSVQPRHHHPCYPAQVQHSHQRYNSPVTDVVNKLLFCLIHRKLKVFKYSSPTFLSLTLLGCCIMYRYDNVR